MANIEENRKIWGEDYNWSKHGDEWSAAWGTPSMQWYGTIMPRIHRFVPAGRILEIACGFGRWTYFLKELCTNLVAVDLAEKCLSECSQRFSDCENIRFHLTDGKSLEMVKSDSIDFVFSFDSLVHADVSVMSAYISQFPRILRRGGAAFIHHSNLGQYQSLFAAIDRVPKLRGALHRTGILDRELHWRDPGVSAALVRELSDKHGLNCHSQETIHWGTKRVQNDCFSVITKSDAAIPSQKRLFRNPHFSREKSMLRSLANTYCSGDIPRAHGT